jgi:hypothetical protein
VNEQHAFSLLNGSLFTHNSKFPNNGPEALPQMIAYDESLHGKDTCVVKLKIIASGSIFHSPYYSGGDHEELVKPPMQFPSLI